MYEISKKLKNYHYKFKILIYSEVELAILIETDSVDRSDRREQCNGKLTFSKKEKKSIIND